MDEEKDHLKKIQDAVKQLLVEIPPRVTVLAACKTRSIAEIMSAYEAGLRHFGHNYVQEAQATISQVSFNGEWHLIGHLQRNKAAEAVRIFDVIETIDSAKLVLELEKQCGQSNKILRVLIEVNSGREPNKYGVMPDEVETLAKIICGQPHLRLEGLMTMGPLLGKPEESRPYFIETNRIFRHLKTIELPNANLHYLSMGMSNSYQVAIQEGANLVRLGTAIFGER